MPEMAIVSNGLSIVDGSNRKPCHDEAVWHSLHYALALNLIKSATRVSLVVYLIRCSESTASTRTCKTS